MHGISWLFDFALKVYDIALCMPIADLQIEQKIKIMHIYEDEIDEHPFPRSEPSIRALSTLRGGIAGCTAAEAFMILKEIEKDE